MDKRQGAAFLRLRRPVLAAAILMILMSPLKATPLSGVGRGQAPPGNDKKLGETLSRRHAELLTEKGLCDEQGREIDGRISKMIVEARRRGAGSDRQILDFVLEQLNFSPSNLGGFPEAAFDRSIGEKLGWYGHAISSDITDATAEGSACPVGGIGAGSYEWTISGNFRYWFLKAGWMVDDTVWADQFHIYMKRGGRTMAQTLSTDAPPSGSLSSWRWKYPAGRGSYYALYPKAGFSYEKNEAFPVRLAVVQFSPVIPGNYRETSYPVAVYRWILKNDSGQAADVSIMLTWENMVGWEAKPKRGPRISSGTGRARGTSTSLSRKETSRALSSGKRAQT